MSISVAFENHVFHDHAVSINTKNLGITQLGTRSPELHRQLCKFPLNVEIVYRVLLVRASLLLLSVLQCITQGTTYVVDDNNKQILQQ